MFNHASFQILVLITRARIVQQSVKFSTQASLPDLLTIIIYQDFWLV